MCKFEIGQKITAKIRGMGFEDVTIIGMCDDRGRLCYRGTIPRGIVTIPVSCEDNYKVVKKTRSLSD